MRLALLIDQLAFGGTERQFLLMARGFAARGHEVKLFTFFPGGGLAPASGSSEGFQHEPLLSARPRRAGTAVPVLPRSLRKALRKYRPDVLYSALHMPNLVAAMARGASSSLPLVWGIRIAGPLGWKHRLPRRLCGCLASRVRLVISNSQAGARECESRHRGRLPARVVPNGVDGEWFAPRGRDETLRAAAGCTNGEFLVGLVGRLDPIKRHDLFLRAAGLAAERNQHLRFVCVTPGQPPVGTAASGLDPAPSLLGRLSWQTSGRDIRPWYSALDLLVSSSEAEGFSNTIAEAMAMEVPCVATGAGDSHAILGPCGTAVEDAGPEALAEAILAMAELTPQARAEVGRRSRARILDRFSPARMLDLTEKALQSAMEGRNHA